MVTQLVGLVLLVGGLTWLLGPWALVAAGLALLVVPELLEARRTARDLAAAVAAERVEGARP
jgi:hypothetical protein